MGLGCHSLNDSTSSRRNENEVFSNLFTAIIIDR
jgi:hypothetical protein